MKKLIKALCVAILSILALNGVAKADQSTSYNAQQEFRAKVLDLLKLNDIKELETYINAIPDCEYIDGNAIQDICTFDRIDDRNFVTHVYQRSFKIERKDFTVVNIDVALYDAFESLYSYLYRQNYRTLDIEKYKNFYNRFRGTWLEDRVEKTIIRIWQRGDTMDKYTRFSCLTGERLFTTIYLSDKLGIGAFKYVSDGISMDLHIYNGASGRVRTILNEMKHQAKKLNALDLFQKVLHAWFYSIISYEGWDEGEKEYYQGTKQDRMYRYLDEEGWDAFGKAGIKPNSWERHTIKLNILACRRVLSHKNVGNPEKICSAFEKGAEKYWFYFPPYEEPSIEDQIAEIQTQFQEKYVLPL